MRGMATRKSRIVAALLFGAPVALVAIAGGLFNPSRGDTKAWYDSLAKPAFNPPDAIFGPVWGVLYVLIAIAGARAWLRDADRATIGMWIAQLVLNGMWSPLFFGAKQPAAALAVIVLMVITIAAFIVRARRFDKGAVPLMLPYLAWVSFATALNFEIVRLNG